MWNKKHLTMLYLYICIYVYTGSYTQMFCEIISLTSNQKTVYQNIEFGEILSFVKYWFIKILSFAKYWVLLNIEFIKIAPMPTMLFSLQK